MSDYEPTVQLSKKIQQWLCGVAQPQLLPGMAILGYKVKLCRWCKKWGFVGLFKTHSCSYGIL